MKAGINLLNNIKSFHGPTPATSTLEVILKCICFLQHVIDIKGNRGSS